MPFGIVSIVTRTSLGHVPLRFSSAPGLVEAEDPEDTECAEFLFELPDGIPSRFRYFEVGGHAVAYLRVPNRDVIENPSLSLQACADRVTDRFVQPHIVLELSTDAKATFMGYQTLLNVKSNAAVQAPTPTRNSFALS